MEQESVYGRYGEYLPLIMNDVVERIRRADDQHARETGEPLFEHVNTRIKSDASAREKCDRKGLPQTPRSVLFELRDAIGIRLVCSFLEDIFETVEAIRGLEGVSIIAEKDYIKKAKPNGYRSYHLIETPYEDVFGRVPGHYFVEVQLRTIAMDTWAALEHQLKYKKDIANSSLISAELKRCADELAACDVSMQTIRELIRNS